MQQGSGASSPYTSYGRAASSFKAIPPAVGGGGGAPPAAPNPARAPPPRFRKPIRGVPPPATRGDMAPDMPDAQDAVRIGMNGDAEDKSDG
jgi:hypothetical protein